jgi:hypothetical protein
VKLIDSVWSYSNQGTIIYRIRERSVVVSSLSDPMHSYVTRSERHGWEAVVPGVLTLYKTVLCVFAYFIGLLVHLLRIQILCSEVNLAMCVTLYTCFLSYPVENV